MENHPKVVELSTTYKSASKITNKEFFEAFYIFLNRIKITESKEEFLEYILQNPDEVNYYMKKSIST